MKILIQILTAFFFGLLISNNYAYADQQKPRARLSLSYLKLNQTERYLNVKANARIDRKLVSVFDTPINFYLSEVSDSNLLGIAKTDENGLVKFELPKLFYDLTDTVFVYQFIATIENHSEFRDAKREIEIYDAELFMNLVEKDSQRNVAITVTQTEGATQSTPQPEVELMIFVKRQFGNLPISEEFSSTDEEGLFSLEFPNDIPGDEQGSLEIIASIIDNDLYGNIQTSEKINWGIIPEYNDETLNRSLWAAGANAPIELVLFTISLIAIVWGIFFYIIYQLYIVSKLTLK